MNRSHIILDNQRLKSKNMSMVEAFKDVFQTCFHIVQLNWQKQTNCSWNSTAAAAPVSLHRDVPSHFRQPQSWPEAVVSLTALAAAISQSPEWHFGQVKTTHRFKKGQQQKPGNSMDTHTAKRLHLTHREF